MRVLCTLVLFGCLSVSSSAVQEGSLMTREQAIETLQSAETLPPDRGMAAAQALLDVLQPGDHEAWTRLAPLLESKAVHIRIRYALLDGFIRNADARIADALLSMALGWSEVNRESILPKGRWEQEWNDWSSVALMPIVIDRLCESPLRELIGASDRAMRLIREVALGSGVTPSPRGAALTALLTSPASPDRKAQVAVQIVIGQPRSQTPDTRITMTLRPADYPSLRQVLDQSGGTADTIHWGAMSALAHLGDTGSRDLFVAKQSQLARTDPKQAEMIRYYLWQIDAQNPPTGLLQQIGAPDDHTRPHDKLWAMRRALELGLPKEDIRRAIFDYAPTVQPERRRDSRGRWMTLYPGLGPVKAYAIDLGILTPDDLPDVPYSEVKPTP